MCRARVGPHRPNLENHKKLLNRVLQAQEAAPGGRGGLGIKNSPPGSSVHWGVVGGCDSGPKEGVFLGPCWLNM